jgi:hypothetical protein
MPQSQRAGLIALALLTVATAVLGAVLTTLVPLNIAGVLSLATLAISVRREHRRSFEVVGLLLLAAVVAAGAARLLRYGSETSQRVAWIAAPLIIVALVISALQKWRGAQTRNPRKRRLI